MGRSWKEKPWKYKNDKNFQKKQKQKNKHFQPLPPFKDEDGFGHDPRDNDIGGLNDYAYGM